MYQYNQDIWCKDTREQSPGYVLANEYGFFSCLPAAKPSGLRTMGLVLLVVVWGGQFV